MIVTVGGMRFGIKLHTASELVHNYIATVRLPETIINIKHSVIDITEGN